MDIELIWVFCKSEYFCTRDWTRVITLIRFRKSVFTRIAALAARRGKSSELGNTTAPIAINIGNATRQRPAAMIRKLQSGEYRLYSRKVNPKTGKRRNLGTFKSRAAAEKHERDVQYFKRH